MTGFPSPERAPAAGARPFGTTASPRPTTLSGRAARRLAQGPLDAVTLMREVCQVERLQADAAERMAQALLGSHPEFILLPSGHWALASASASAPDVRGPSGIMVAGAPATGASATGASATGASATGASAAPESAPDDPGPSLRDITFSVVDVETTGTRAAGDDRITEIAIATVRGGAVIDVYSQLVNPERPIPPYITALTQISWEMVRDQPRFRHVADQVLARLAGSVFVAHNASFDWRFVSEEIRRGVGHELSGPRLCTVRLARVLLPELSRRSLDHLTHHFGIAIEARHRAAGDAVATAQALCRMLIIAEREGVRTWAELDALVNSPASRRRRTASDRRRRAFPLPVQEDSSA